MTQKPEYCTNSGVESCNECSMVNYGRDCRNNPIAKREGIDMTRKYRLNAAGLTIVKHEGDTHFLAWRDNPDDDVWAIYFDGEDVYEYRIERNGETWKSIWASLDWPNMASDRKVTEAEYWSA